MVPSPAPPLVAEPPPRADPLAPSSPSVAEPYWNSRRTVGVVIAGLGVVGVAVGAAFGAARGAETHDASVASAGTLAVEPNRSVPASGACVNPPGGAATVDCQNLSNALNANGTDAHLEDTFLVGGAALLVVGALTAFWPGGREPPPGAQFARLTPLAGPRLAGLQWAVSF
jgi:hypothetical protein